MKFCYPSVTLIENKLSFQEGKYCSLPTEYLKKSNALTLDTFYRKLLTDSLGIKTPKCGTDLIGFDYIILDYICYVGILFINDKSSTRHKNKKRYPGNKFTKEYIYFRLNEEYDFLNINKYVPVEIFSQSLHELRGLNSKIAGHVDSLMQLTDEENWEARFDQSQESLKKLYVGSRLTKFILDNIRFFNPQFIQSLSIDKDFRFMIHKSIFKLVKIYRNDFAANKAEIQFSGTTNRFIRGEREYFEILLKTLLENALKFSTDKRIGPKIEIKELNSDKVQVIISSFGRLVPFEERNNIFTRGYRSTVHGNTNGTGMGLFIAKSISTLYDISINYEAKEVSEDTSIKMGWNNLILMCNKTEK